MTLKENETGETLLSIEQLTEQHASMNERKVRAQTNLENAQQQLESLQAEALENFGTSDIDELKTKLAELEETNRKQQKEYQDHLQKIEKDLQEIESNNTETK